MKRHIHDIAALLIVIGCIGAGIIQGGRRADQVIAGLDEPLENPTRYRADVISRFITGNLMIGVPFSVVAYFALRPFTKKKQGRSSQNKPSHHTA